MTKIPEGTTETITFGQFIDEMAAQMGTTVSPEMRAMLLSPRKQPSKKPRKARKAKA